MKKVVIFALVIFFSVFTIKSFATPGYVESIIGEGKLLNLTTGEELTVKSPIDYEEEILAKGNIMAKIIMEDQNGRAIIKIKPNTKIKIIKTRRKKEKSGVFLFLGKLFASFSGKKDGHGFKVVTYNAIAGVEGTKFIVNYQEVNSKKITILTVVEGKIKFSLKNALPFMKKKFVRVYGGETAKIINNKITGPTKVTAKDLSDWAFNNLKKKEEESVGYNDNQLPSLDSNLEVNSDDDDVQFAYLKLNNKFSNVGSVMSGLLIKKIKAYIDGYSKINGKPLYFKGKSLKFPINVGTHDITMVSNGVIFRSQFEIDEDGKITDGGAPLIKSFILTFKISLDEQEKIENEMKKLIGIKPNPKNFFDNLEYDINLDGKKFTLIPKQRNKITDPLKEAIIYCKNALAGSFITNLLVPADFTTLEVKLYYVAKDKNGKKRRIYLGKFHADDTTTNPHLRMEKSVFLNDINK